MMILTTKFLEKTQNYDGTQLRSHWIFEQTEILGHALLAFMGPCDVKLDQMVDQVDVKNRDPIFSPSMLHFLGEFFDFNLKSAVFLQRFFMAMLSEKILSLAPGILLKRRGDDLFVNEKKLSVSVATCSPVSSLIHVGLNLETENTPVPTVCLKDLGIDSISFAQDILKSFAQEFHGALQASVKVRAVP